MRFCGANASGSRAQRKRSHSPLDRRIASVTLASRDPTSRSFRDSSSSRRRSHGVCPRPVDERRKEKESARRNAGGHLADALGNTGTDRETKTETGPSKIEVEEEGNSDSHPETKGEEDSDWRRQ